MNKSIETIWKEFHLRLKSFIVTKVNNPADVDDIIQEVFIKIYTRINTLKDPGKLEAWIWQITRHTIIDYYRRTKTNPAVNQSIFDDAAQAEENTDGALEKISVGIEELIDTLPEKYRVALRKTHIEGLKQSELAEYLNISLSGAKSRVQRGRELLKEVLLECCQFEFDSAGTMCDYSKKVHCCNKFSELKIAY
jgi:RNA polymerase sigma-70 factor, ECF subfamily